MEISRVSALCGGVLGVAAVLAGAQFEVPGFSIASGFWGTDWLDSYLYAIGNDTMGLIVVSVIWFVYGAFSAGIAGQVIGELINGRDRSVE